MTSGFGIKQDNNGYMHPSKKVPSYVERYDYDDGRRRKEALFEDVDDDGYADLHAVSLFGYIDDYYKPITYMIRWIDNDADGIADAKEYYEKSDLFIRKIDCDIFEKPEENSLRAKLEAADEDAVSDRDMWSRYFEYGIAFEE